MILDVIQTKSKDYSTEGRDNALKGYALLKPREAWEQVQKQIVAKESDFNTRYACLKTARFLFSQRAEVVTKKGMQQLLLDVAEKNAVMADFAIEDMRRFKLWDHPTRVLTLFESKSQDNPILRRAILRYALECPDPRSRQFVTERRRLEPDWVQEMEEFLALEKAERAKNSLR